MLAHSMLTSFDMLTLFEPSEYAPYRVMDCILNSRLSGCQVWSQLGYRRVRARCESCTRAHNELVARAAACSPLHELLQIELGRKFKRHLHRIGPLHLWKIYRDQVTFSLHGKNPFSNLDGVGSNQGWAMGPGSHGTAAKFSNTYSRIKRKFRGHDGEISLSSLYRLKPSA